jgi:KaiC/GvpD/RAD55 family RecA-like ATPase
MLQKIQESNDDFTLTGIPGFDTLLGKGIPRGHVISVFGGPGSGKTTFSLQYLLKGIKRYNEPGIYISLDETIDDVKRNMSNFGWNLQELEDNKEIMFLDASFLKRMSDVMNLPSASQSNEVKNAIDNLGNLIRDSIAEMDAKRVVLDPMSTMIFQYPDLKERRLATIDVISALRSKKDCTSFIIMDLRTTALEREFQIEEFLTQGTIVLQTINQPESGLTRICLIEKMRGVNHDTQPHLYDIREQGIEVFPMEKIYFYPNK